MEEPTRPTNVSTPNATSTRFNCDVSYADRAFARVQARMDREKREGSVEPKELDITSTQSNYDFSYVDRAFARAQAKSDKRKGQNGVSEELDGSQTSLLTRWAPR